MPELTNIQTYEKLNGVDFKSTLFKFANVLQNIGLWNDEIKYTFDTFEWVEEEKSVYSPAAQLGFFKTKFSEIPVRPHVMSYSPDTDETFKDNWLACELLIEAESLRSFESGEYHPPTYELVKTLTREIQKEFKETGVYFTDEMQDGEDFDGVRCSDKTKIWQFDYAILPLSLEATYSNPPKTHKVKKHNDYVESWNKERWKDKSAF